MLYWASWKIEIFSMMCPSIVFLIKYLLIFYLKLQKNPSHLVVVANNTLAFWMLQTQILNMNEQVYDFVLKVYRYQTWPRMFEILTLHIKPFFLQQLAYCKNDVYYNKRWIFSKYIVHGILFMFWLWQFQSYHTFRSFTQFKYLNHYSIIPWVDLASSWRPGWGPRSCGRAGEPTRSCPPPVEGCGGCRARSCASDTTCGQTPNPSHISLAHACTWNSSPGKSCRFVQTSPATPGLSPS